MILMPLLWILAIILVVRALTLPGAIEGIELYLKPDFSKLGDYNIWLSAFGQIFFTLSLGMGIMIAYASNLPERSDIANNAFIVALANCAFRFLVGFAISLVETVVAAVIDRFGIERRKAGNLVVGTGFLGSLVYTTKAGLYWPDIVDHFVNYYGLVLVGLLEVISVA